MGIFARGLAFLLLAVVLLAPVGCGRAGGGSDGWVSSGGELFQNRQNPWWLKNVATVSYCVKVDTLTSSARPAVVERNVREVIEYWQTEFGRAEPGFFRLPKEGESFASNGIRLKESLGVAMQRFVLGPCVSADLKILVGAGALTSEEREFLAPSLSRHLAAAVRTDYDEKTLRGKGFIYVASDKGADAPKVFRLAGTPTPGEPRFLKPILAHEMGHVFGIPHVGARSSLMAERYPESLMRWLRYVELEKIPDSDIFSLPSFFATPQTFFECSAERSYTIAGKFFGIDMTKYPEHCPTYDLPEDGKKIGLSFTTFDPKRSKVDVGAVEDLHQRNDYVPAFTVELSDEQTLFPDLGGETLLGPPLLRSSTVYGTWRSPDRKKESPVVFGVQGAGCWQFSLAGVIDGKLTPLYDAPYNHCH